MSEKNIKKVKSVYDLNLHESMDLGIMTNTSTTNIIITRVPGGWIYHDNKFSESTFVPYSPEFNDIHNVLKNLNNNLKDKD